MFNFSEEETLSYFLGGQTRTIFDRLKKGETQAKLAIEYEIELVIMTSCLKSILTNCFT